MRIDACFVEVGHAPDGTYIAKNKKFVGYSIVFKKANYNIEKSVLYKGQNVINNEEDPKDAPEFYRLYMGMIQHDGWELERVTDTTDTKK